jgi:hypothetical protein
MTFASSMSATCSSRSPQRGHARTSKPKLRCINSAHSQLVRSGHVAPTMRQTWSTDVAIRPAAQAAPIHCSISRRRAIAEQAGGGQPRSLGGSSFRVPNEHRRDLAPGVRPRRPGDARQDLPEVLTHDVFDKTVKGRNPRARLTPSKETCAMDIPRRYVTVFMKWSTEALD